MVSNSLVRQLGDILMALNLKFSEVNIERIAIRSMTKSNR